MNKILDFGKIEPAKILRDGFRLKALDSRIRAMYISGAEYNGEPTEMFAYLGVPDTGEEKYPAIILIHGGAGHAFHFWTTQWLDRGFAVLAIDHSARHPMDEEIVDNPKGGPKGWEPWKENLKAPENTWSYITVKTLLMAEKLLASLDFVDTDRIYSHGVSWGGYLSYLFLPHSSYVKMAGVSYTTAHMYEIPRFFGYGINPTVMGEEQFKLWCDTYDSKNYIPLIKKPVVLVCAADDANFPANSKNKTLDLFGEGILDWTVYKELHHGHMAGALVHEVVGKIADDARGDKENCTSYRYSVVYTTKPDDSDGTENPNREWVELEISEDEYMKKTSPEWHSWYYNRITERNYIESSKIFGGDA